MTHRLGLAADRKIVEAVAAHRVRFLIPARSLADALDDYLAGRIRRPGLVKDNSNQVSVRGLPPSSIRKCKRDADRRYGGRKVKSHERFFILKALSSNSENYAAARRRQTGTGSTRPRIDTRSPLQEIAELARLSKPEGARIRFSRRCGAQGSPRRPRARSRRGLSLNPWNLRSCRIGRGIQDYNPHGIESAFPVRVQYFGDRPVSNQLTLRFNSQAAAKIDRATIRSPQPDNRRQDGNASMHWACGMIAALESPVPSGLEPLKGRPALGTRTLNVSSEDFNDPSFRHLHGTAKQSGLARKATLEALRRGACQTWRLPERRGVSTPAPLPLRSRSAARRPATR